MKLHFVTIDLKDHLISNSENDFPIFEWCDEHFGDRWALYSRGRFAFQSNADAILFRLMWGQ